MVYLVIVFVVAAAGILRLWLQQRREKAQMSTINGFNTALEKISPETPAYGRRDPAPARRPERPALRSHAAPSDRDFDPRLRREMALDPRRRAAARARIKARRRARVSG